MNAIDHNDIPMKPYYKYLLHIKHIAKIIPYDLKSNSVTKFYRNKSSPLQ